VPKHKPAGYSPTYTIPARDATRYRATDGQDLPRDHVIPKLQMICESRRSSPRELAARGGGLLLVARRGNPTSRMVLLSRRSSCELRDR
jgi:hypothetical protein